MGFEGCNLLNDGDEFGGGGGGGEGKVAAAAAVCCSICLDSVTDDGKRSWAKLQCNHQFHLDCIGSAFNAKGAMQCPNCRKTEKGQWLYAKGSQSLPHISINRSPIPAHVLFHALVTVLEQFRSPNDEGEFSSSTTHNGATAPTAGQSAAGPHIAAYDEAIHPSLSTSSATIPASYSIIDDVVVIDLAEHLRNSIPISSSRHHIRGGGDDEQQTVPRGRRIPTTYDVQPYPDSIARSRDRVEALEAYSQQSSNPSARQASGSTSGYSGRSNSQNSIRSRVQVQQPPIPSPSNHAANRLPSISPGRVDFEAARVRSENACPRYGAGGSRHSQNQWWI